MLIQQTKAVFALELWGQLVQPTGGFLRFIFLKFGENPPILQECCCR
jgi:hypothetical protein